MKLNKHGKPYIDPDQFKKQCRIVNKDGLIYHPTKAPAGLCKCGVMLELKPSSHDHVFETVSKAQHAISHTLKFLKSIDVLPVDEFIIEKL